MFIDLGKVDCAPNDVVYLGVEIDCDGIFSSFIFKGAFGIVDMPVWYVEKNDKTRLKIAIEVASARYDELCLLFDNNKNNIIDMKSYSALRRLGVNVEKALTGCEVMQGKSYYTISELPLIISNPPNRDEFEDHLSYRVAMNEYMNSTLSKNRKRNNHQQLIIKKTNKPNQQDIYTYNEALALYQYINTTSSKTII